MLRLERDILLNYDVADFNLSMTLSLYKSSGGVTESIFNWAPTKKQWWVTGFNPKFTNPDPNNMTMLCSVEFDDKEMFESFVETSYIIEGNATIITDEKYQTVWIMWE